MGAGAAGLATAAALRGNGVSCVVVERSGQVGTAWQTRYDSFRLHTIRWLSGLPGMRIPPAYGPWVSRDDFQRYLNSYRERHGVDVQLNVEVRGLRRTASGWLLETSAGERRAGAVVIATGYNSLPTIPAWPGLDRFTPQLIHSVDYREPSQYAGKNVLVVGAGNSAAEIARDLVLGGATVDLSVRTPPNIVKRDTAGIPVQLLTIALRYMPERLMNPVAGTLRRLTVPDLEPFGLPAPPRDGYSQIFRRRRIPILDHGFVKLVQSRQIRIVAAVDRLSDHQVHLTDGSALRPDAVIAATGYRPGLEEILGRLDVLGDDGIPKVHGATTWPSAPGLYFVGVDFQLSGLLREIGLEAQRVGRAIAQRRRLQPSLSTLSNPAGGRRHTLLSRSQ